MTLLSQRPARGACLPAKFSVSHFFIKKNQFFPLSPPPSL